MTATYTFDIFCTLDGFGSNQGAYGGYWGKQGPELLQHRHEQYEPAQRMVFGAATYRDFVEMLGASGGDAVDIVTRLKEESDVPLRSHGSLTLNHALLAAGLVDRVQVTLFPVVSGQTGLRPIFGGAADFDLELLEQRTLDGRTLELVYRPSLHAQQGHGQEDDARSSSR